MTRPKLTLAVASLVFFLSGSSALIFETVWFRVASSVLGSSVWSAAAVLMAFMAGLGLGNAALALWGRHVHRPFRLYIIIELVIGFVGVASVYFFFFFSPLISPLLANLEGSPEQLNLLRFSIACLVLVGPALAMGATLPVLQKALHHHEASFSSSMGRLYGWNTIGAVFGTLFAEFFLIQWLGIQLTAWFACGLNLLAAVLVARIFIPTETVMTPPAAQSSRPSFSGVRLMLLGPFLAGFILLALEVVWFRYITLSQVGSSIIFAVMLAIVLAGLALGGLLVTRMRTDGERLEKLLLRLPLFSILTVTLGYAFFQYVTLHHPLWLFSNQYQFIGPALLLMLPTSILSGMLFPLYGEWLFRRLQVNTAASGALTLANTFGAALGSAVATFVLLPLMGIELSIVGLSLAYLLLSLLILCRGEGVVKAWPSYVSIIVLPLVVVVFFPLGSLSRSYEPVAKLRYKNEDLVHVKEELNATLQYFQASYLGEPLYHRLATNSYSMSSTTASSKRYMKLFVYLPYALHWDMKDVLQISYGVGNTAEAVVSLDSMTRFDIVDVSADILALSELIHKTTGVYPLKDPRAHPHIEDGRFYLQTTNRQYDLITGEPPPPKMAGISNLYTQEYFSLVKKRLKPKGIASYWLPVHNLYAEDSLAIIKAFCNEFSDCSLWNGSGLDFILIGSKGGIDKVYHSKLDNVWRSPVGDHLKAIGLEKPAQLGALFMADHKQLAQLTTSVAPVTDNYPQRISPDFADVFAHSHFYEQLLNIKRREQAWKESDYIRSLFSQRTIHEAERYFEIEGLITAYYLNPMGYMNDYALSWDNVLEEMQRSTLETVPLLWFGLNARKIEILNRYNGQDLPELRLDKAKLALARGHYAGAIVLLEEHLMDVASESARRETLQLLYVSKAMRVGGVDQQMQQAMKAAGVDDQFIAWLKRRLG